MRGVRGDGEAGDGCRVATLNSLGKGIPGLRRLISLAGDLGSLFLQYELSRERLRCHIIDVRTNTRYATCMVPSDLWSPKYTKKKVR